MYADIQETYLTKISLNLAFGLFFKAGWLIRLHALILSCQLKAYSVKLINHRAVTHTATNEFSDNNGHRLEILHTALTKCTATPAPPTLRSGSPKKWKWWIYSLPPCMQELWRLSCNEAVCIMHELSFERHATPNVVIFCLLSPCRSLSLPFLPPWLTVLPPLFEPVCRSPVHCGVI